MALADAHAQFQGCRSPAWYQWLRITIEHGPFVDYVDLPIYNDDFPYSYLSFTIKSGDFLYTYVYLCYII